MIHSSAFVHPDAQLDPSVTVGPYAVLDGPVVVGARTHIHSHAVLSGHVTLGADNVVCPGAVLGGWPQDLSFDPAAGVSFVRIGDGNVIHGGTKPDSATVVGSRNLLMVGAHLGHNVEVGDDIIIANNVLLGGYAKLGSRAFLGGGAVVHQFTRVGQLALLEGAIGGHGENSVLNCNSMA